MPNFNLFNLKFAWDGVLNSPVDPSVVATHVTDEEYITPDGGHWTYGIELAPSVFRRGTGCASAITSARGFRLTNLLSAGYDTAESLGRAPASSVISEKCLAKSSTVAADPRFFPLLSMIAIRW